jgi:acyl-CoA thioesterase I
MTRRADLPILFHMLLWLATLPFGQAVLASEIKVPRISAGCDAPSSIDIALPAPLPNLQSTIADPKRPIRVVAIGSSSTVGVGASQPDLNYPNQLKSLLANALQDKSIAVLNRGVSGELAGKTAERLIEIVEKEQPTLVLWQVGTNDGLAGVPLENFADTVRRTIRAVKAQNVDIVIVGMQYASKALLSAHYLKIRDALLAIANEEDVLLVRRFDAMEYLEKTKGEILLSNDGLHLNDLGYRCMAEHIAKALVVSSFLKKRPKPQQK